jgi:hypothetical protein
MLDIGRFTEQDQLQWLARINGKPSRLNVPARPFLSSFVPTASPQENPST